MLESRKLLFEQVRRRAPLLGGGLLVLYALWRRSWESLLAAPAGGALLYYGLTNRIPVVSRRPGSALGRRDLEVHRAVTIRRPPQEVYDFWRRLENLPRFMSHLESVEELGDGHSRWQARSLPGGLPLSWEARVTADEPGKVLAWETLPGASVSHRGRVTFEAAGADEGTELHVYVRYAPAGGAATGAVARLLQTVTSQQLKEEIRHCKEILEAGEVPTIDGQPSGRKSQ